ncbi:CBS domain-containing protein [Pseudonocardia phyllosphaerae]|uniref:CBS domain-containing protein n=1 Tax=Pseudonocardia phyllosphaerae TaxID=3390502 RepID=UPI003978E626
METAAVEHAADHAFGRLSACGPDAERYATAGEAMIRFPKAHPRSTTVARAREEFRDDHVHALLVVEDGILLAVVERGDLEGRPGSDPVLAAGAIEGRAISPDAHLLTQRDYMQETGHRRLAVVDDDRQLLGLLCLKRSGAGFCSDAGVAARAAEREEQVRRALTQ